MNRLVIYVEIYFIYSDERRIGNRKDRISIHKLQNKFNITVSSKSSSALTSFSYRRRQFLF